MNKLNIALVTPPISGHRFRGTGTYGEELFKSLEKLDTLSVSWVKYGSEVSKFDVIHYPYFDPFFITLPIIKTRPTIVTVHDLIPFQFPQYFERGIRGEIKWFIQKLSLNGIKVIITDSIASKKDITQFTGISQEKINVIYLGVRKEFQVIKSSDALQKIKRKYNLPDKFLLHVGDVNYNKNIPGLIKAFLKVNKSYPDLHLVLVGNGFMEDSSQLAELKSFISQLGVGDKVKRLGFIDLSDLIAVYNMAEVYLQVSYAEGFGLPVLEAMASGCSTVVSNNSSLLELAGEASLLVDPYSEEDIVNSIELVLQDKTKRENLIDAGLKRVKEFTWDKCARETVNIYKGISG